MSDRWIMGLAVLGLVGVVGLRNGKAVEEKDIASRVVKTSAGEAVLIQEVKVDDAAEEVWKAFATSEGWSGWASPLAE